MMCKQCSDWIGLPAEWRAHSKLESPGTARTNGYLASRNQKLYACKTCATVLCKGKNTGWSLAVKASQ
jgi:RNase P subunit RPR2